MRSCRTPLALIVLVLVAAMVHSGCSDGEDDGASKSPAQGDTTASSTGPSRAEVVEDGDSICAETFAAVEGLEASSASASVRASQRADLYEGMVESLRGLDSDNGELTDLFASGRDLVTAAESASEAASAGDAVATVNYEDEIESALEDFHSAAADFGFEECSGGSGTELEPVQDGTGTDSDGVSEVPESEAPADDDAGGGVVDTPSEADGSGTGNGGAAPGGTEATSEPEGSDGGAAGSESGDDAGGESTGATGGFSPG